MLNIIHIYICDVGNEMKVGGKLRLTRVCGYVNEKERSGIKSRLYDTKESNA